MAVQKGSIIGVDKLIKTILRLERKSLQKDDVEIIVGYTANYALPVHEKIGMKLKGQQRRGGTKKGKYWDPQGRAQPKFLETPAREMRSQLVNIVRAGYRKSGVLETGLLVAGLALQAASQKLVPVDTGNLKASAFTRKV